MRIRNLILGAALVAIVVAGGLWWWRSRPEASSAAPAVQASGTIEVEEVTIASQVGGQIVELAVGRGDSVRAGDVLVRLETDMLDADLARTQATVNALQAAREAAYDAWQAALGLQSNPLEIDLQIAELQTQLDVVELQLEAARLSRDAAASRVAETQRDGLEKALSLLEGMRAEPYAIRAQVSQAEMYYQSMDAMLQIALSTQDLLRLQRDKMTLVTPRDGYVVDQLLLEGEVAAPLAPILLVADLESVTVTVYIPETLYGQVSLGDPASVTVDSLPNQVFKGTVTYISPRAEFTPANVQTQDERARLVYAVEISVDNPDLALKPGMIADVEFGQ